jgi:hypothetical protein
LSDIIVERRLGCQERGALEERKIARMERAGGEKGEKAPPALRDEKIIQSSTKLDVE